MPERRAYRRAMAERAQGRRRLAAQPSILASVSLSAAQREQGQVTPLDLYIASLAQLRHPGVRWWWGERAQAGRRGAWCYLCDRFITPGTVRAPLSRTAQAAILAHRDQRHGLGAPTLGIGSAGTPPAGAAPQEDPTP